MRPPDPDQNPAFAAFIQHSARRMEADCSARGVVLPPGAWDRILRVMLDYLRDHPLAEPNTFYDVSLSRIVAIAQEIEGELPDGKANPEFTPKLTRKLRDTMEQLGRRRL